MFHGKLSKSGKALDEKAGRGDGLTDNRSQSPAELYHKLVEAFLRLVKFGIGRIVVDVELIKYRRSLAVFGRSELLGRTHLVEVSGHGGQHAYGARSVEVHRLKHRSHLGKATLILHRLHELKQRLVGIRLEELRKFLHLDARYAGELRRILEHLGKELGEDGGSCRLLLHVLVEGRGKTHYLSLRHVSLSAYTGKIRSEVDDISCIGRGVLCQLVQGRASGEHGAPEAFRLVLAEDLSQFADLVNGTLTEVIPQGYIDLVGSIDKLLDRFLGRDAEPPCSTGKLIQLLP